MNEAEPDVYEGLRKFRMTERAQMIEAIRDLIEEARKRVKSNYTPSKDRAKWMKLAGQLIWYKDQVLRSMSYEALEKDVAELKQTVSEKLRPNPDQPRTFLRTTVFRGKRRRRAQVQSSAQGASKRG